MIINLFKEQICFSQPTCGIKTNICPNHFKELQTETIFGLKSDK